MGAVDGAYYVDIDTLWSYWITVQKIVQQIPVNSGNLKNFHTMYSYNSYENTLE